MSKIQNEDIKSEAQLVADGGTAAQLPNDTKVYVTADSLNKTLYQAITDGDLAGGGGGINYVTNPELKVNANGYTAYKDAAGTEPVDGSGGSPTLSITRSTSSPLAGVASGLITKPASNTQGEGINISLDSIDAADRAKLVLVSFDYDFTDPNYADADFRLYGYDNTNAALIRLTDGEYIYGGRGTHYAILQVPYNCSSLSLLLHCATTSASAMSLKIDRVSCGPMIYSTSAVQSDARAYTPTFTGFGAPTNVNFKWWQHGDILKVKGRFTTGATTPVEARISLPNSVVSSADIATLEIAGVYGQSVNAAFSGYVTREPNVSYFTFSAQNASGNALTKINGNILAAGSGVNVSVELEIPIKGWSSNAASSVNLSSKDIKSRATNTATTAISAGAAIIFGNVLENRGGVMWTSSTQFTALETGDYFVGGEVLANATITTWSVYVYNVTDSVQVDSPIGNTPSAVYQVLSNTVALVKGKTYEIRTSDAFTPNAIGVNIITIKKLSSPQTITSAELMTAFATTTAGQAIANNTLTTVVWGTLSNDTHGSLNTSTGDLTLKSSGSFDFFANGGLASLTVGTGIQFMEIYKNGVRVARGPVIPNSDANSSCGVVALSVPCVVNDVITARILHTNGVSRNMTTTAGINTFGFARRN